MKKKETSKPVSDSNENKENDPEGYPLYPPSEDIYNRYREVKEIDPEDVLADKDTRLIIDSTIVPDPNLDSEVGSTPTLPDELKELEGDFMGTDLDVPGAELDDEQEETGNEDEENNYYSIGGDNHTDLEEDNS
jgi:hypothetical protein